MADIFPFFVVILAGLFFSEIFRRLHLPWVIALILGGIIIGPYGLDMVAVNGIIPLLGEIGLIFLMFDVGLETRLVNFKKLRRTVIPIAFLNSFLPLLVGIGIGFYFGYNSIVAFLLGILFMSSSVAIIVPVLESCNLMKMKVGRTIISATILEDISSLLFFTVVLHFFYPSTFLPLPLFYLFLFSSVVTLYIAIPKIRNFFLADIKDSQDLFERELRVIFALLLGTVAFFGLLGIHSIIAGFFTGLLLSQSVKSKKLRYKIHAISYGLFIPIFFVAVGLEINFGVFKEARGQLLPLVIAIVCIFIVIKFLSAFLGAKLVGFKTAESSLIGSATLPRLSTTFAIAITSFKLGIFDEQIIAVVIILSIITIFVSPMLMRSIARGWGVQLGKAKAISHASKED